MILNSPLFMFLFLPAVLALYFAAPQRLKNAVLLAVSLFFYAWGDSPSLWVLIASIAANYAFGLLLERAAPEGRRKLILAAALGANLGLLFYFKYLKFAITNLGALHLLDANGFDFTGWRLPLGISFFTFGNVSYLLDIYRKKTDAARNPVELGLYIAHFAKIMAGPIVRYADLSREIEERRVTLESFGRGARRFVFGLGKKVLIANTLARVADALFKESSSLDMPTAWLGILCYTLQIYFDFSGYSDMAIGLGRMFGFTFMENFNYPYLSRSIQEFWRRWHISLSAWFRDYLYIPLGGSRVSEVRVYFNLVVVFLLCGLWHGASWSFVAWGFYHGVFLVLERVGLGKALQNAWRPLSHFYAVLVIMIGWVFFRADDLPQALHFIGAMFSFKFDSCRYYFMTYVNRELLATLVIATIGSTPVLQLFRDAGKRIEERGYTRLAAFYEVNCALAALLPVPLILVASAMQLAISTYSPFIYAKF